MPSPTPSSAYPNPRVKPDGSGFEFWSDAEDAQARLAALTVSVEPGTVGPAGSIIILNPGGTQAFIEPRSEAVAVSETKADTMGAREARSESAAPSEQRTDSLSGHGSFDETGKQETVTPGETGTSRLGAAEARSESASVGEARTDALAGGPVSISDSFDSALTNPPWVTLTTPSGAITPGVSGGAAVTPGGYAGARRTETFSASQWAEIEITTPPSGTTARVCVRVKPVAAANTPRIEFSRGNYDDGEGGWYQGGEVLVWDGAAVNSVSDLGTLADNFMRLEAYDVDSSHVHITVRSKATAGAAWTIRWQGTVAVPGEGLFSAGSPGFTLDGGSIKSFAGGDS